MIPLIEESEKRVARGEKPLFNSHMYDGSELPLEENLAKSKELLERCAKSQIILEIETGVVGGEEDGVNNEASRQTNSIRLQKKWFKLLGSSDHSAVICMPQLLEMFTGCISQGT